MKVTIGNDKLYVLRVGFYLQSSKKENIENLWLLTGRPQIKINKLKLVIVS